MKEQIYYIYILECNNNKYYTGYTTDIVRRYKEHVEGSVKSKFTRSFKPIRLARCWRLNDTMSVVLKIEHYIKTKTKNEKMNLINQPGLLEQCLENEMHIKTRLEVYNPDGIIDITG